MEENLERPFYPITKDYVFKRVLEKKEGAIEEVIRRTTNEVIEIVSKDSEYSVETFINKRGVRFDLRVVTSKKEIYDLEMQKSNLHDLAKRAQYILSASTVNTLQKRTDKRIKDIPRIVVIFFCAFDSGNMGEHVYIGNETIRLKNGRDVTEESGLAAEYVKIFVNTKYKSDTVDDFEILTRYIGYREVLDEFVKGLDETVIKVNEEEGGLIMNLDLELRDARGEGYDEGLEQGITQGLTQGVNNTALNMLKDNVSNELVSKYTGLSLEEVKKLHELM